MCVPKFTRCAGAGGNAGDSAAHGGDARCLNVDAPRPRGRRHAARPYQGILVEEEEFRATLADSGRPLGRSWGSSGNILEHPWRERKRPPHEQSYLALHCLGVALSGCSFGRLCSIWWAFCLSMVCVPSSP